jgi:predicted O-linked N-acetylglucosamine transferase (SPINDLY family)
MIVANLARILAVGGDRDEAVAAFEKAVQLDPLMAGGHNNLGRAYKELGRITDASVSLRRAVALSPSEPEVLNNLGILGFACGDARVASVGFRRAIATDGHRPAFVSNLVTALLYADDTEPRRLFEAASLSDHVVRSAVGTGSRRSRGSAERLRVGIVSADLCDHPVGRNVLGVFEHCRRIALHVYADVPREDGMTAEFRRHADAWTTTVGQSDAEVAETVGRDGIDLLVVLAGHTAGNRPALAAHRAARVQVGFHDLTTSGIIGMDWWLTDSRLHPEGSSELFTERLWRLPCFYLHRPPAVAPAVGPAPWRSRGGLSFISCNNAGKISRSTIRAWSRVLRAVPGSRLILKYRDWFADRAVQRSFAERFEDAGVNRDRLDFLGGHADRGSHLALLNQADIALDTFPFNGSTTSFEALWMGVPVVTWAGDRFVGRVGASVLGAVGLDRLVGRDEETFVASAVALAEDKYFLEELRGGLRNRVMQSPLCDAENYTRTLEEAFLRMCA